MINSNKKESIKEISLDQRLLLCSSFVRKNSRLADIGTDHALLPIFLAKKGIVSSAIACDIKEEPLSFGKKNIEKFGLEDFIETRLSDGLNAVSESEVTDIVIAGMGGEMIIKILDSCSYKEDKSKRFILQPI
ncbi:MAG: class I SAM-dependent methyltransferase, partial [Acutalibacteraceae bacterium]